jgi:hypothetical protein
MEAVTSRLEGLIAARQPDEITRLLDSVSSDERCQLAAETTLEHTVEQGCCQNTRITYVMYPISSDPYCLRLAVGPLTRSTWLRT